MSVGGQANKATIDQSLTDLAVALRNIMTKVERLSTQVNGQGNGIGYLTSVGYDNVTANPNNPGSQTDAAWALQAIAYMTNLMQVYEGTLFQGGTGGGGAIKFDFENALANLWAGQLG